MHINDRSPVRGELRELTTDELDTVTGGMMAVFQAGNFIMTVGATADWHGVCTSTTNNNIACSYTFGS